MTPSYTIIRDTREAKNALLFPAHIDTLDPNRVASRDTFQRVHLTTVDECLNANHPELHYADYYIQGFPTKGVIEAKGSLDEIANNCLTLVGRRRFTAELDYLKDRCQFPILLLRGSIRAYLKATRLTTHPGVALSSLTKLCLERGIWLHLIPFDTLSARHACGEWAAHLLVTCLNTHRSPP